jgi:hypothetical protein
MSRIGRWPIIGRAEGREEDQLALEIRRRQSCPARIAGWLVSYAPLYSLGNSKPGQAVRGLPLPPWAALLDSKFPRRFAPILSATRVSQTPLTLPNPG